jgi:hypothetical protein
MSFAPPPSNVKAKASDRRALPKNLKLKARLLNAANGQPLPTVLDPRTGRTYAIARAGQKYLVQVKLVGAPVVRDLHCDIEIDGTSVGVATFVRKVKQVMNRLLPGFDGDLNLFCLCVDLLSWQKF